MALTKHPAPTVAPPVVAAPAKGPAVRPPSPWSLRNGMASTFADRHRIRLEQWGENPTDVKVYIGKSEFMMPPDRHNPVGRIVEVDLFMDRKKNGTMWARYPDGTVEEIRRGSDQYEQVAKLGEVARVTGTSDTSRHA